MRKVLFLAPLAVCAAPASALDKPATAAQIVDGMEACKAITTPTWLELKALPSHGGAPYRKAGGRRTQVVSSASEKRGNEALIIISREDLQAKNCAVYARLETTGDYGPTAQAVSQLVGMPDRAEGPTYFWTLGDKTMRLDPTGDRDKPIARFEISAIPQESAE